MKEIKLKEQKEICIEILQYLHDFCRANNLKMTLAYGSLIGAIRHKGYIPWDDDIDVMMPREHYERLMKTFPNHPYYKLIYWGNDPTYTKTFATLNDIRTHKEEYTIRKKFRKNLCLNIDIYPFDNFPDDSGLQNNFIRNIDLKLKYLQCFTWKYSKGKSVKSTILKNLGITWIRTLEGLGLTSLYKFQQSYDKFITQYNTHRTAYCGCSQDVHAKGILMPSDIFNELIEVEFEGRKYFAPAKYNIVLTTEYGDYMKLPPESERVPHHLCKCYWR